MKFTVSWLPELEASLAELWTTVENRKAVTQAANAIDLLLANDPLNSLTPVDDLYFLRMGSLLVLCDVNLVDRTVRVIDLRHYDPQ